MGDETDTEVVVRVARLQQRAEDQSKELKEFRTWVQGEILLMREDLRRMRQARLEVAQAWVFRLGMLFLSVVLGTAVSYIGVLLTVTQP